MAIPEGYLEKVYAGVLGKIIGVYLGRPVEGWSHDKITERFGELAYYVHASMGRSIIECDDDITGTFIFLKALEDHGYPAEVSPEQIGRTWLNYNVEERTILWWGGLGSSSEHTAYLRLKSGIPAPESGSIATNGRIVAEQIGAQIFIDGWAMVSPGDPERAAELAKRAASVSHDGEAIYGAQVIAAMEALAFVETDIDKLVEAGVSVIPDDCDVRAVIDSVREWRASSGDWRAARDRLAIEYPYSRFGGGCPMVPNHGLIILGLLFGDGDFGRSMIIENTSGWDTDCNAGNLGCLLGIRSGLEGLDSGADFRGPVADRLYLPCADSGLGITDAATEAVRIVNAGKALAGEEPVSFKGGARYHFELPGSVQGWRCDDAPDAKGAAVLENHEGHSPDGERSLAIRCSSLAPGRVARVYADTFIPADENTGGYGLMTSPTIYPGQTVRATLVGDEQNSSPLWCKLFIETYGPEDELRRTYGPDADVYPGEARDFEWQIGDTGRAPIARIGVEAASGSSSAKATRADGTVYLERLGWRGAPLTELGKPEFDGEMWRRAWVNGCDMARSRHAAIALNQASGTGLYVQGTRDWTDYSVSAEIRTDLSVSAGIAARVQGMRRYYALLLCGGGKARLVKCIHDETVLAECDFDWEIGNKYELKISCEGDRIRGRAGGIDLFDVTDGDLACGSAAVIVTEGMVATDVVKIEPVTE